MRYIPAKFHVHDSSMHLDICSICYEGLDINYKCSYI